jgi:hypothetical protein
MHRLAQPVATPFMGECRPRIGMASEILRGNEGAYARAWSAFLLQAGGDPVSREI